MIIWQWHTFVGPPCMHDSFGNFAVVDFFGPPCFGAGNSVRPAPPLHFPTNTRPNICDSKKIACTRYSNFQCYCVQRGIAPPPHSRGCMGQTDQVAHWMTENWAVHLWSLWHIRYNSTLLRHTRDSCQSNTPRTEKPFVGPPCIPQFPLGWWIDTTRHDLSYRVTVSCRD